MASTPANNHHGIKDNHKRGRIAEYQKIILTHDLGFFNEFRRRIGASHTAWSFQHFKSVPGTGITLKEAKTEVQKAEDYLNGNSLDEAAICLRRASDGWKGAFHDFHNAHCLFSKKRSVPIAKWSQSAIYFEATFSSRTLACEDRCPLTHQALPARPMSGGKAASIASGRWQAGV